MEHTGKVDNTDKVDDISKMIKINRCNNYHNIKLSEIIETKIYKYVKKNINNSLSNGKCAIPFGDFGCLAREIRKKDIEIQKMIDNGDIENDELNPQNAFFGYTANIYECVENYINKFNRCNKIQQRHILEDLKEYKNYSTDIFQKFPFEEWLYHPIDGNNHSGMSYGFTTKIILHYFTDTEEFKANWHLTCKRYI